MSAGEKTLDETLLRLIARWLGQHGRIASVSVFPREKPESVVATIDPVYYPDTVRRAELELRAYTNGDFNFIYFEAWDDGIRQQRWDRHNDDHEYDRDHVHPFPDAGVPEDRDFPHDALAMLRIVLRWIDERLGTVWRDTESSSPP